LNSIIKSLLIAIDAHELYITSSNHPTKPTLIVQGTDVHIKRGKKMSKIYTRAGLVLVIIGFIMQLSAYIFFSNEI
jgi:hypothetical protein